MKAMKIYVVAAVIAMSTMVISPAALATRAQTLENLLASTDHLGTQIYYTTLGETNHYSYYRYIAYVYAGKTYEDYVYAWYYAPSGSYMQLCAKYAYQFQYNSLLYEYYAYLGYGSSYAEKSSLYADYALLYAGYAQYFAAYNS